MSILIDDNILQENQREITRSRNRILDVYKGILIVLVVLRHVLQYSVSDEGGILTNFIWAVQMPGFMLVAGYFAARKIDSMRAVGNRILIAAQHYVLPYLSWFLLVDVLLLGKFGRNPLSGFNYILNHVDGGLWFLWVIFVLSIIATLTNYALYSGRGRIIKVGSTLFICFGILLGIAKIAGLNFLGVKYILYYSIFYGFGWMVKWTENLWKRWPPKLWDSVIFLCFILFLGIVFNFDLYHSGDNIRSIAMRVLSGFAGNVIILTVCKKYLSILSMLRLDWIGMFTLEIYVTHMCVNNLMEMGQGFFTITGFGNFICSLILTVLFTSIMIATIKAIPAANFLFYGKRQK